MENLCDQLSCNCVVFIYRGHIIKKPTYEELELKVKFLEEKSTLIDNLQKKVNTDKQLLHIILDTMPNPVFYKDIEGIFKNAMIHSLKQSLVFQKRISWEKHFLIDPL